MSVFKLAQARVQYREALESMRRWRSRDTGDVMDHGMAVLAEINAVNALDRVLRQEDANARA